MLYRDSGVDIEKGEEAVKRIKSLVERTLSPKVLKGVGPFSSLYDFGKEAIVASADGIGTKILVAIRAKRYKNLGKDIVNHCVNDILTCGARPLFFLDYFATGKLDVSVLEEIISGMSE
ncbi:phosphoribosylformylglycinamidine cyclo-ligase, partial [bacterium]